MNYKRQQRQVQRIIRKNGTRCRVTVPAERIGGTTSNPLYSKPRTVGDIGVVRTGVGRVTAPGLTYSPETLVPGTRSLLYIPALDVEEAGLAEVSKNYSIELGDEAFSVLEVDTVKPATVSLLYIVQVGQ